MSVFAGSRWKWFFSSFLFLFFKDDKDAQRRKLSAERRHHLAGVYMCNFPPSSRAREECLFKFPRGGGLQQKMDTFPLAEIAGLFSEVVAVSVLYVKCVFKIPQIDNRDIFYTYLFCWLKATQTNHRSHSTASWQITPIAFCGKFLNPMSITVQLHLVFILTVALFQYPWHLRRQGCDQSMRCCCFSKTRRDRYRHMSRIFMGAPVVCHHNYGVM